MLHAVITSGDAESRDDKWSILIFLSVATILLPAHPSIQAILHSHGIPAAIISFLLAVPVLTYAVFGRLYSSRRRAVLFLFFPYIFWLCLRSIFSEAIGESNYLASLKSLLVLAPLALLASLVASINPRAAARVIFALGIIAVIHYCWLLIMSDSFGLTNEFRSLSGDAEKDNYQATSFYFGFVGVAMVVLMIRGKGWHELLGFFGLILIVILMTMIGARSSIVSLAIVLIIMFLLFARKSLNRIFFVGGLAVFLIAAVRSLTEWIPVSFFPENLTAVERFAALLDDDDSSQRMWLFASALKMWLESVTNFIFGGGLGTFPNFIGMPGEGWYPHNFILESLAEGGIIGGTLLAFIGIRGARKIAELRLLKSPKEHIYLGAMAIYAVVAYQFMGGVQTIWIPAFFVALHLFLAPEQTS